MPRTTEGTLPTDYAFTGQRQDSHIKLLYLRARWYDPYLYQWIQPDPIISDYANPQTLNRYAYVTNNPVRYTDPSGRTREDYYVFVQGSIVTNPLKSPCGNKPEWDWKRYLVYLREKFGFPKGLDWNESGFPTGSQDEFASWASTHTKYVHAYSANPSGVANAVNSIPSSGGKIFLIGHSMGGVAVVNYLYLLMDIDSSTSRLGGAFAVDAPLGELDHDRIPLSIALWYGFSPWSPTIQPKKLFGDCSIPVPGLRIGLGGLGDWAKRKGIASRMLSYEDDIINPHSGVADIPFYQYDTNPNYQVNPKMGEDLERKHGYLLTDLNGPENLLDDLFKEGLLR